MDRFLRKAEHVVKDHILKDVLGIDDEENAPQGQAQNQQAHGGQAYSNQAHDDYDHNEQTHDSPGPSNQPSNHPIEIRPVDTAHRFQSFAPETSGNAKWYVDGASYFWAVSMAIEEARESIYILDWWLSPELYLRRPPSSNEKYRLDNMLKAAAERGVDVKIIVYKEVPQALTLDSAHTRHALEALHPKISVFRHPDHLPTNRARLQQAFSGLSLDNLKMNSFGLAKVSGDALKELYGSFGDTVLYWAHHEKLCVVDRHTVFMGGLDMCFGRYDTNSHPIADAHPGNLDSIIFPGQDFNNARVYDFEGVDNWDHNQLDRAKNCRMGWSDIAISLSGGIVDSLIDHFTDRWNFIFEDKYMKKDPGKYQKLQEGGGEGDGHSLPYPNLGGFENRLTRGVRHFMGDEGEGHRHRGERSRERWGSSGGAHIQLCRSASDWSAGHPTEHSIANAYMHAIESAEHFVYIENQFFITATGTKQYPIENTIGASIVSRIVRAHSNRENFRVIVLMPAVPAFAGDLKSDGALGTRAIMEYQYNSINRGGNSIIECLKKQGIDDWQRYIGFYNLRNYDRINNSSTMSQAEGRSGVRYDDARRQHDDLVGRRDEEGYRNQYDRDRGSQDEYDEDRPNLLYPRGEDQYDRGHHDRDRYDEDRYEEDRDDEDRYEQGGYDRDRRDRDRRDRQRYERGEYDQGQYDQDRYAQDRHGRDRQDRDQYDRYQSAAAKVPDQTWDTVSSCYMDGGPDIRTVPWQGDEESEINAFVSEELYIHSKVLIADDRLVICGSANLNDRSQLGHHDSEIAVVIEDQDFVEGSMDGRPFRAARFATSLRRQLWRKHLGWLPDQPCDRPTQNWTPVTQDPQDYDWGSEADQAVADPMSEDLWRIWTKTARTNTEVFSKVFHNVPNDKVRTWEEYNDFFSKHFIIPGVEMKDEDKEGRVDYGHVVREEFPGGAEELKEWLSRVRGTLVEMPLDFLIDVKDLAKEGLSLNAFTDELYT